MHDTSTAPCGHVRLSCDCSGALTVVVVNGALACSRCAAPLVAEAVPLPELVDQHCSPLGKAKHLRLVRAGELKAMKSGKRVLVRREAIDAWLAAHPAIPRARSKAPKTETECTTEDDVLRELGAKRAS